MDELAVLDFETASFEARDGAVEVAFVTIDDHLNVLTERQSLLKPYGQISPGAAGVHSITMDMVKDKPTFREYMAELGHPFAGKHVLVIGHNIAFDLRYVEGEFGAVTEALCTLRLARRFYPDAENHKLPTLMYMLGLKVKGRHNALDDVYTCLELVERMMRDTGMTLEDLYHVNATPLPIKKITFGEHKGKDLKDIPAKYRSWLLKKADIDPDLRHALERL